MENTTSRIKQICRIVYFYQKKLNFKDNLSQIGSVPFKIILFWILVEDLTRIRVRVKFVPKVISKGKSLPHKSHDFDSIFRVMTHMKILLIDRNHFCWKKINLLILFSSMIGHLSTFYL